MLTLPFIDREPYEGRFYAKSGRRALHRTIFGQAEDMSLAAHDHAPFGYSGRHRIAITYFGAACWRVGNAQAVIDSNNLLFFSPGDEFSDWEIGSPAGRSAVLLTINPEIFEEIAARGVRRTGKNSRLMSAPASLRIRLLCQALLRHGSGDDKLSNLRGDELLLETYVEASDCDTRDMAQSSRRLVDRAKEFLHGLSDDAPISLAEVADAVGCSPIYLTQSFRRHEGIPLYRYHLRLRLSQALLYLKAGCEITPLAFELGFSSHSHFTSAFRSAFGMSPSKYRDAL
jgi:AraC-like DNA-binding protein